MFDDFGCPRILLAVVLYDLQEHLGGEIGRALDAEGESGHSLILEVS